MKKLYSLILLCCLGLVVNAQTVNVNATGTVGSYKTGYIKNWTTATRNDGDLNVKYNASTTATNGNRRGWAVFDLAGAVPAGATITAVSVRFTKSAVATGTNPTVSIHGWAGDMSTLTTIPTIYANCISGAAFNTTAWGGTTGTITRPFNATGISFISTAAAANSIVSIGFDATAGSTTQIFTITGYGGTAATQPQLQITYSCTGVTGVTATPSSSSICAGSTFTLSGAATGAGTYLWSGPGGFTSTDQNPTTPIVSSPATAGVYTLTAYYPGNGCGVSATTTVTSNPLPTAITGNLSPCAASATTLSGTPSGGTWSINSTSGATLAGNVVTAGGTTGSTTVTYTLPVTGCQLSAAINTIDTPTAITGLAPVICASAPTTLSSTPTGGSWSISPTTVATINSSTGVINGLIIGTANVTYTGTNGCVTRRGTQVTIPPSSTITSSTGSFQLCPSLSITLSNTVAGGIWSVSGGSATIDASTGVVTGVSIGAAPITYSNVCGIATATVNVTPPPPPITGVFSTCVNAAVTLHDSAVGGVWSSSDNTLALAAAGFGTVTGVSAGTLTITYTDVSGCVAITPFTVKPIPSPILGTANTCIGSSVNLYDTTLGGIWSSNDTFIAKVNTSGLVSGLIASNTTITYTSPATGCYITTPFTVNPLPVAITGNNAFCNLKSDTLFDLSLGGSWSSGNTGIAVVSPTGLVTGVNGGTAIISYTLPTGCYRTRPVIIHPLPNAPITYNGGANTLSTGNWYDSYQWYYNGSLITGATSPNLAALDNGSYSVYVVDSFGCEKMSNIFNISAVGVNNVDISKSIKIQPNPATNFIRISSPVSVNAVITTMEGRAVMEQADAKDLDISLLSNGMYMIQLFDTSGRRVSVEKLIKQ